jgi:prolyl-tRNA synthetase
MRQSQLFTKTERTAPKDEVALNAQLLTRGGFIYKNSAGVYSFLPLGLRVLRKVSDIVREEMNKVGGQEVLMSALHDKKYLQASGRWGVDVVYKVIAGEDKEPHFNISWTHEEIMSEIAARYINSYKDLPFAAYQIQTKFRHEPRAKSGLLRGREFLMKDMYSFHRDEKDLYEYYDRVRDAYFKVFERCGLKAIYTLAAGGDFTTNLTHEFQVALPIGEDTIYVCEKCGYAENDEISKMKAGGECPKCGGKIKEEKAVEVGNIFPYGDKYSRIFNVQFTDENGEKQYAISGAYGIGISRLIGVIVEKFNDEKGIIWPESVAPFRVHLLSLNGTDGSAVYESLQRAGIEVVYDDRDMSAGEKFAEADLLGIPWRAVVSPKVGEGKIEIKKRSEKESRVVDSAEIKELLKTI